MKPCACLFIRNCANGDNSNLALRATSTSAQRGIRQRLRGRFLPAPPHELHRANMDCFEVIVGSTRRSKPSGLLDVGVCCG